MLIIFSFQIINQQRFVSQWSDSWICGLWICSCRLPAAQCGCCCCVFSFLPGSARHFYLLKEFFLAFVTKCCSWRDLLGLTVWRTLLYKTWISFCRAMVKVSVGVLPSWQCLTSLTLSQSKNRQKGGAKAERSLKAPTCHSEQPRP